MRKSAVVAIAVCLIAASCASTEQRSRQPHDTAAEQSSGGDVARESSSGSGGGGGPVGADESGRGGGQATSTGAGSAPRGALGRGITGKFIKIGFVAQQGADEFYKAFGVPVTFGDDRAMIGALLDDLNKRGGILGRQIRPVFGNVSVPSSDQKSDAARLCAQFTEDEKVFAVLNYYWVSWPDYFTCLSKSKTLHLSAAATTGDNEFMKQLAPYYRIPSLKGDNRMWLNLIPLLVKNNFFGPKAKVGLVYADMPMYNRVVKNIVKPMLKRAGHPVQSEFKAAFTYADSEIGSLQSQMSQATLRFNSAGVTHVFFVPGGYMGLLFMQNANGQRYYPRYNINTDMAPAPLIEVAAPKEQLKRALGIGWRPAWDVTDAQHPYSAQEKRCVKVMRDHGIQMANRQTPADALPECDLVWAFEAAAKKAGRLLNTNQFLSGLREVGTSWQSVLTFKSNFGPGKQDSSFAHRVLYFNDSCTCFSYKGGTLADIA
jgi:ABC-type branched-subunit amino acid transport system substrate-binding protein